MVGSVRVFFFFFFFFICTYSFCSHLYQACVKDVVVSLVCQVFYSLLSNTTFCKALLSRGDQIDFQKYVRGGVDVK
jgi:hypothetical protein